MQAHYRKQRQQMKEKEQSWGEKKIDEGPVLSENLFQELFMNIPDDRT